MESLARIFPANDFTLLAAILLFPLLGAFINGVFGKRLGKEAVTLMGLVSVGASFLAGIVAFLLLSAAGGEESSPRFVYEAWHWLSISGPGDAFQIPLDLAFSIDQLSGAMTLVITGIGFLIHLYSTKYMEHDAGYHRFFCYLNLFIFSMLVLVLGDNLPVLFIGWEGVGLCSYLLIGFWFSEEANAAAGKKAFITNRIGDFGLLVAMGLLVYHCKALDWQGLDAARDNLLTPVKVWPVGNEVPLASMLPDSAAEWVNRHRYVNAATLVGLALFLGCAGKSAQIPLYVWLPDAMAGPTPVSALIHAATMVTAGVYLMCRMAGVFVLSPAAMFTVAMIGALTAVFAASIAFVQNDIKKVLAYSTVSQLGYMFLATGVGAFTAGFFHVVTHAFFKACLFLAAGSVIHAMHVVIHDHDASQDMRNMGGLRKYMPQTFWTFALSWAAIIGVPFTSGFFSKDAILLNGLYSKVASPTVDGTVKTVVGPNRQLSLDLWQWPDWGGKVLFALGLLGAVMTAFYMTRLFVGTFFGDFKGWTIVKNWKAPAHDEHHDEHHEHEGPLEGPVPHESPWQMTVPLMVLGGLALVGGLLSAHMLHIEPLDHWLEPVFAMATNVKVAEGGHVLVPALATTAAAVGAGGAYYVYVQQKGKPAADLVEKAPKLHALVYDKWRVDELYEETVIGAVDSLADFAVAFDEWVVDGIIAKVTSGFVKAGGWALRQLQTGRVQAYAAAMVFGVGGLGWFLIAPQAAAVDDVDEQAGTYRINAAGGLLYRYRWSREGECQLQPEPGEDFGTVSEVRFTLEPEKSCTVTLEVENAFGSTSKNSFSYTRPKVDKSGLPANTVIQRGADGKLRLRQPGGGNQ